MSDNPPERGDDVKEIQEGNWTILWDGTREGWLRCLNAPDRDKWI